MTRFVPKFAKKAGSKPGSVVYVGRERKQPVSVKVYQYDAETYSEHEVSSVDDIRPLLERKGVITWIRVIGIHDVEIIESLGELFDIHPLTQEDIVNTAVRPQIDIGPDKILTIFKRLVHNEEENRFVTEQRAVLFGKNWVISFQELRGQVFDAVASRIKETVPRVRFLNADYLAYTLMDAAVDNYFVTMEQIGEEIDKIQDDLVTNPQREDIDLIFRVKRELLMFRKAIWPLREVIGSLTRSETKLIHDETDPYLRDLYDHTVQAIDTIETLRDMASGLLDIYLSSISNRMNEIMKVLTIMAAIFIPLGFLAGVYGMNFDTGVSEWNLPELGFAYGYPLFWLIAICIAGGLLLWFKKKNWI